MSADRELPAHLKPEALAVGLLLRRERRQRKDRPMNFKREFHWEWQIPDFPGRDILQLLLPPIIIGGWIAFLINFLR